MTSCRIPASIHFGLRLRLAQILATALTLALATTSQAAELSIDDLEEPWFSQVDLKISKPFAARNGRNPGEFFVQIFNLFDRFNGGPIEGAAISRDFGEPIGQIGPPRTIEVGFRIGFNAAPPLSAGDRATPAESPDRTPPRESSGAAERR